MHIYDDVARHILYALTATFLHYHLFKIWNPRRRPGRQAGPLRIIIPYSIATEGLNIPIIIRNLRHLIPHNSSEVTGGPEINYKLGQTTATRILKMRNLTNQMTRPYLAQHGADLCACNLFPAPDKTTTKYVPSEHLLTLNCDALGSKAISEYLSPGAKCRTSGCSPWFEGNLLEYIKQSLSESSPSTPRPQRTQRAST